MKHGFGFGRHSGKIQSQRGVFLCLDQHVESQIGRMKCHSDVEIQDIDVFTVLIGLRADGCCPCRCGQISRLHSEHAQFCHSGYPTVNFRSWI